MKELLETRIKPVIHEDGGDIEFVKMENGTVYVKLHVCGVCVSVCVCAFCRVNRSVCVRVLFVQPTSV